MPPKPRIDPSPYVRQIFQNFFEIFEEVAEEAASGGATVC